MYFALLAIASNAWALERPSCHTESSAPSDMAHHLHAPESGHHHASESDSSDECECCDDCSDTCFTTASSFFGVLPSLDASTKVFTNPLAGNVKSLTISPPPDRLLRPPIPSIR